MERSEAAKGVRVKFRDGYEPFSLANKYLSEHEYFIEIEEDFIRNDLYGDYVFLRGASPFNSCRGYLKDLEVLPPSGITNKYGISLDEIHSGIMVKTELIPDEFKELTIQPIYEESPYFIRLGSTTVKYINFEQIIEIKK